MHGVILKGLKDHVTETHGSDAWSRVLDDADVEPKLYLPVTTYPTDEWVELLETTVAVVETDRETLLTAVGERVGPALLDTFRTHVRPEWSVLDAITNLDSLFARLNEDEPSSQLEVSTEQVEGGVDVRYRSGREEYALIEGLLSGIAAEYDEPISVTEQEADVADCRYLVEPA